MFLSELFSVNFRRNMLHRQALITTVSWRVTVTDQNDVIVGVVIRPVCRSVGQGKRKNT